MKRIFHIFRFFSMVLAVSGAPSHAASDLSRIRLPSGFKIELVTDQVPDARSLALSEKGTLFVGTRASEVFAIPQALTGTKPLKVIQVADDLRSPSGVALRKGSLYVSEISRILRFDAIESKLGQKTAPAVVLDTLPKDEHHGWKFIAFGPDDRLYIPVGAPCNVCERQDPRYASLLSAKPDGSDLKVYASGIRNTLGFDWNPRNGELWFTDNGRDWLGDNLPPDELNRAPKAGMNFGFPYCYGRNRPDPQFGKKKNCASMTPAAQDLGAHVAALGMHFYRGKMFPEKYRNQILIAEHGSWNRSSAVGYRLTLARLNGKRVVSYEPFVEGWLQKDGKVLGRPVDMIEAPDGSLLVSDDMSGAVYRISYSGTR